MTQPLSRKRPEPHRYLLWLINGPEAVAAFEDGNDNLADLRGLGPVKQFGFETLPEMNAFILAIMCVGADGSSAVAHDLF